MIRRCSSTILTRTDGCADTTLTAEVTGPASDFSTNVPAAQPDYPAPQLGSVPTLIFAASATRTATAPAGSAPARSTASVAARYIDPVSR